jgi:peptide/nickel transport system permease protein
MAWLSARCSADRSSSKVVTSWPGLGRLMLDALRARDIYLVAGCAGAGAVFVAAGTLLSDVALAWVDPRTGR